MDDMKTNDIEYADDNSIVITGISGKLPKCANLQEFKERLINKEVMLTDDESRWKHVQPEIPKMSGKVPSLENFDLGFFGFSTRAADNEDAMSRMLMETTLEAILDAGYNPTELIGTNTAVYSAICFVESPQIDRRRVLPVYLSYIFRFNGPSMVTDTACSSSMYATNEAYKAIKEGLCDRAIVCAGNLLQIANVTLQFAKLGVLSPDGQCRPFDEDGKGYVRSEGIVSMLMEKRGLARRVYAEVVHSKTNSDGYKSQGITFPSTELQRELLAQFYDECKIDPRSISFVEAHGTGTPVGDPEELMTLDHIFCKDRETPLYMGSLKGNIGHTEPASGISSIAKVILGMESGCILPSVNYAKPRKGSEAIEQGRIIVVTEKMPFPSRNGLVAVNSFGFGGSNAHLLLRWNPKEKVNNGLPRDDLPRLVCLSGRTREMIETIMDDLKIIDVGHIKLLHSIFSKKIDGYDYRGFIILDKTKDPVIEMDVTPFRKKQLCFVFTGCDENWMEYAKKLMCFQQFANSMDLLRGKISRDVAIDISTDENQQKIVENTIGTMLLQISLMELLKSLEIRPDILIGVSTGQLVASYVDGCLTLQDIITIAIKACTKKFGGTKKVMTFKNWRPNKNTRRFEDVEEYFKYSSEVELSLDDLDIGDEVTLAILGQDDDHIGLFCKSIDTFLVALGRLYLREVEMNLDELYPEVQYPVPRGTPMISPRISWRHHRPCWAILRATYGNKISDVFTVQIGKEHIEELSFFEGHVIDGRTLFPATGYLYLAWKYHSRMIGIMIEVNKVIFRDIQLVRVGNFSKDDILELQLSINKETGRFEVTEKDVLLVRGFIHAASEDDQLIDIPVLELTENKGILKETDIYKEFRLRGYHYKGMFRALKESNIQGTRGIIKWDDNYITFMDSMLQMKLIQEDTKSLFVPTSIDSIILDCHTHAKRTTQYKNNLPVMANKDLSLITCGGVQIQGLGVNAIPRRKAAEPVLEYSKFVPYEARMGEAEAVRCLVQLILENTKTIRFKCVEVIDDDRDTLTPLIQESLGDLPLIRPDVVVLTQNKIEISNARVENGDLNAEEDSLLVIVNRGFENRELLEKAMHNTQPSGGFIITREDIDCKPPKDLTIVSAIKTSTETIFLLMNRLKNYEDKVCLDLTDALHDFTWLALLQETLKSNKKVVIYARNGSDGLLGLFNCLKQEFHDLITCVLLMDAAPNFHEDEVFYKRQLSKNLSVNVWKDGSWGTYRHLLLPQCRLVDSEHCYATVTRRGDLSSLKWIESSLSKSPMLEYEDDLVDVYYSALNFRDIMTASGRLQTEVITRDRIEQDCIQGIEFSGRNSRGKRIMGIISSGGLSTLVLNDSDFIWPVPDHWTLEDAATVPIVYGTVLYALKRIRFERDETILIHAGSGGVGQAAINMAIYHGLTIFTTVGTPEKKEFILQHFPQIKEEHIGDSRSTSFEQMVFNCTNGRGVDIVLNSLSEEKLQASARCLAPHGRFLEIGKFDLANNTQLAVALLDKQATYCGIMLDQLLDGDHRQKKVIAEALSTAIKNGSVKPLTRKTFEKDELEPAFRYMATGKHIGKVLIKIRDEEDTAGPIKIPKTLFKGIPRFYCHPKSTYVILGGLGGFGLELADWLVIRGAKKLVLTSRSGVKTGYQALRLNVFESYGVTVLIRSDDISTAEGCEDLLRTCEALGPVDGIFNLAVVLQDGLFENQTTDQFRIALTPKAIATMRLDTASRDLCPNLRYFVVFSSVSCGRGNAGQTNYGMANSVMERVCELRKRDGYPALAIQWGAIGEVGLVAEMQENHMEMEIGGTLQQRISNCLQVLDTFLRQEETIVSSMVVAEKKASSGSTNIIGAVLHILGVTNIKSISFHATFPELGMDSIMAVELKQTLERDYDIFLAPQDMRTLTLAKLKDLVEEKTNPEAAKTPKEVEHVDDAIQLLVRHIGDESVANIPRITMDTLVDDSNSPHVIALAGVEGQAIVFSTLAKKLKFRMTCIQLCAGNRRETVEDIALSLLDEFKSIGEEFVILGYSFGCLLAGELAYLLEKSGKKGRLIFIDGAPEYLRETVCRMLPFTDENTLQTMVLCGLMTRYIPYKIIQEHQVGIMKCDGFVKKMEYCNELITPRRDNYSDEYVMNCVEAAYARSKAIRNYKPRIQLESTVLLAKARETTVSGTSEDFGLSKILTKTVLVETFDGNHVTILDNDLLAESINNFILNN